MPGSDPGMGGIGPKSGEIEKVAALIRRNAPEAVEGWKHQWEIWHRFEPTPLVSACVDAEHYWLTIACWSCKKESEIDLRRIRLDQDATLTDVQQRARCRDCRVKGKVLRLRA